MVIHGGLIDNVLALLFAAAGLSVWRPWFDQLPVHVGCVLIRMALQQISVSTTIIPPELHVVFNSYVTDAQQS